MSVARVQPSLPFDDARATIDAATALVCERLIAEHAPSWSRWEVDSGLRDLRAMGKGEDCSYDRPSIGVTYALWNQGRRTRDALVTLAPVVRGMRGDIRIVDIGCGTGATACALALIGAAVTSGGQEGSDRMIVEGIDSSPFMAATATAIFAELDRRLPGSRVTASFREASWTDVGRDEMPTIVHGGYLLDHSDHLHTDEIAQRLLLLGDLLEVVAVHLTTTAAKRSQLEEIERLLAIEGWSADPARARPQVVGGRMSRCHAVRSRWYEMRTKDADAALWQSAPWWDGPLPASLLLRRPPGRAGRALFADPRAHRLYDDRQAEAAEPEQRLTVITGAAGSGKSIVLAERVARSVARSPRTDPPPCILVTAFNKGVVDYLADAIEQSLRALGMSPVRHAHGAGEHDVETAGGAMIALLNRDKLPHRVFGVQWRPGLLSWGDELERRRRELDDAARAIAARFDAGYLEDELERVIYGQRCFSAEAYRDTDRFGRGDRLPNATKDIIWRLMQPPVESFVGQRIQAFRRHEAAVDDGSRLKLARPWTHVFVDECQDFTATDLQLLARVPPSPHRLCIAGDASQSVHLGRSYRRPGIAGAQWKRHQLRGSYRLPLRVCDALRPLAEQIRTSHLAARLEEELDSVLLESRKSAVPGFRPVVVAGETVGATAGDLLSAYLCRDADRDVLLADCGDVTSTCIEAAAPDVRYVAGRMEKHKGLEWPTVVVSDERSGREDTSETASERLFTAMTRTTRLLVVVLWRDGDPVLGAMLAGLGASRVTFWDRHAYASFARLSELSAATLS